MAVALTVIGAWSAAPALIVVVCFAAFSFFNAAGGDLTGVYPSEVFPSELRASGIGLAAAASRIGAAAGTFLLPVGISNIGVGPSVLIGAAVVVVGLGVGVGARLHRLSQYQAPTTRFEVLISSARSTAALLLTGRLK